MTAPRLPSLLLPGTRSCRRLCRLNIQHKFKIQSPSRRPLIDLPILNSLPSHRHDTAILHSISGRKFKYDQLASDVSRARTSYEPGVPVAFLAENSYDYVVILLSILSAGGIAVPLSPASPVGELKYILEDSQAKTLIATEKYAQKARDVLSAVDWKPELKIRGKTESRVGSMLDIETGDIRYPTVEVTGGGLMLYTSGTTSRPKGVLLSQTALTSQAKSLVKAWEYSSSDYVLHLLPLHHIHGTVNALLAPLLAGSCIEFMFPFNPETVWRRLAAPFLGVGKDDRRKITLLTAVPTIYTRLLATFPSLTSDIQEAATKAIHPHSLRLNISGSAALPSPIKKAWQDLSNGNVLLERYGMTEIGMALSGGLDFADRVDGSVGWPLPSVQTRLVDTDTNHIIQPGQETDSTGREREGEIQIRGPTVFTSYWNKPAATAEAFIPDPDGHGSWFKTGDVATRRTAESPGTGTGRSGDWARGSLYFIRGRKSMDIIKTGGEKVSALEVERELLSLPQISETAVLGLPSEQWGQKVAAVIVLNPDIAAKTGRNGKVWGALDMRRALRDRLAGYKIPQEMKILDGIPRNAMGKVNKKVLAKEVFGIEA